MKIRSTIIGIAMLWLAMATAPAFAQPNIDPEADAVLRQMSEQIKAVPSAVFRLSDTIDDVQADGRKLQFSHIRQFTIVRPDKLRIETKGDVNNRTLWKDGETVTLLDWDRKVYAQIPDPGTIDETIDFLQEEYGLSTPAADLLSDDVYATLTEGAHEIDYIGPGYALDEKCHHLGFVRDDIDYQLWITTGDEPRPRKMVITYKHLPGEPQYTLQLIHATDASGIAPETFEAQIPEDAELIEFHPVNDSE